MGYTLLNDEGEPLPGFYMEIHTLPSGSTPGTAIYVEAPARGKDHIRFLYNRETKVFDVWRPTSPTDMLTMIPIVVGNVIVGLDFPYGDIVTHFALDISTDDEDLEVYDVLAPPVYLVELAQVGF